MADKQVWRCIICSTPAENKPPRRCPKCGAPSARWRLDVDAVKPVATAKPAASSGTTDGAPKAA